MASDEVRGLSIIQPRAQLVALRLKGIETRTKWTNYRGLLYIHASKGFPTEYQRLCHRDPFQEALSAAGFDRPEKLPLGAIVAVARLAACHRSEMFAYDSILPWSDFLRESSFGDFSDGRYGWVLQDVRPLNDPVPCKGSLGLWAVPAEVLAAVSAQMKGKAIA